MHAQMICDNEDGNKGSVVERRVPPGHFPAIATVAEESLLHAGGVPNSKRIGMWLTTPKSFPLVSSLRLSADLHPPSARPPETETAPRKFALISMTKARFDL